MSDQDGVFDAKAEAARTGIVVVDRVFPDAAHAIEYRGVLRDLYRFGLSAGRSRSKAMRQRDERRALAFARLEKELWREGQRANGGRTA